MICRPRGDEITKLNRHRSVGVHGPPVDLRGALPGEITIRVAIDAPQEEVECGSVERPSPLSIGRIKRNVDIACVEPDRRAKEALEC